MGLPPRGPASQYRYNDQAQGCTSTSRWPAKGAEGRGARTATRRLGRLDAALERAGVMKIINCPTVGNRAEQFARFQTDAPSRDNCGAITVRNDNCYLCHNCCNSTRRS